jgi:hypothetical protein
MVRTSKNMAGKGRGQGPSGGGRGMGGGRRLGSGGECVCPGCGERSPHKRGLPCFEMKCPKCGLSMTRA